MSGPPRGIVGVLRRCCYGWLRRRVLLTRALSILILFPILKRVGLGLDWRTAVVMWWGGLRGSVGLALGLYSRGDVVPYV